MPSAAASTASSLMTLHTWIMTGMVAIFIVTGLLKRLFTGHRDDPADERKFSLALFSLGSRRRTGRGVSGLVVLAIGLAMFLVALHDWENAPILVLFALGCSAVLWGYNWWKSQRVGRELEELGGRLGFHLEAGAPTYNPFIRRLPELWGWRQGREIKFFACDLRGNTTRPSYGAVAAAHAGESAFILELCPNSFNLRMEMEKLHISVGEVPFRLEIVRTGDEEFDDAFCAQTSNAATTTALLAPALRHRLMELRSMSDSCPADPFVRIAEGWAAYILPGALLKPARTELLLEQMDLVCDMAARVETISARSSAPTAALIHQPEN